ncbi:GNAT family N-acetyltransferase [Mucilaginibacter boryungensis]|uniref:GNAT family N-acetyltransferase n=1 Tax=Mucilaginibacter boryungensis TaxID=768480 RepID=A0ABR9XF81_9SPHI|nr:GNAT family N-acetyltransferase [Mucilaginibacter boryungensis]MBE9666051.1 GNAT family N-acetyltransferase [Mucilaginibacter boryungensis]
MHPTLETERLLLRPFHVEDAKGMMELYADPDVIKFTADKPFNTLADAERFIAEYDQYDKYNMGRLSTFIKQTGEYIGWCGIKYLADKNEVDIGYRLLKQYRGKGYATEAARACLDYGFNKLGLNKIIGMAMQDNGPSINVFKKLGLKYSHNDDCGCHPGVVYAITKEEWK